MAVKLRLSRFGKTGNPVYRLIAIDEHLKRDGKAREIVGTYDPHSPDNKLELKKERVDYWLSVGAKPTATVEALLRKNAK
ncbi:30S ribosomal protein S16 [Patescibacteria group bacterium]|nr:30S ribosomal protein S16 [Patescibacteria group bacterium]